MTTNHNHNIDTNAASEHLRVVLEANAERALTRLGDVARELPESARVTVARLLDLLGNRLAARDGDGAVTVLDGIAGCVGKEIADAVLDYCLAVGYRNAVTGTTVPGGAR